MRAHLHDMTVCFKCGQSVSLDSARTQTHAHLLGYTEACSMYSAGANTGTQAHEFIHRYIGTLCLGVHTLFLVSVRTNKRHDHHDQVCSLALFVLDYIHRCTYICIYKTHVRAPDVIGHVW